MAKKYSKENNNIKKESFDGQTSKSSTLHSATSTPAVMPGWMVLPSSVIFILFLALAGSMDNIVEKWMGLFSAILILIVMLFSIRSDNTKQYMNPLFFSLIAYVIWGGISTLYAASGKFAIYEFSKLLFALFIYLFVFHFSGEGEGGFKKISLILAGTGSFFGIISIDAASSNILSNIFKALISFSTDVYEGRGAFEEGIRITGIFGNPNIYAGFMAIAVFLSLYLIISASGKKDRSIAASLLAINALSYLLAFSLGSLFMFMIACFIMIGVSDKGKKAALFIVMVETAVLTFLFAMFSMAGLGKNGVMSFIPLAALILNAVFLYFIDFRLRESLIKRISVNGRFPLKTALLVTFVLVVYIVASFSISSDLKLNSNETIMRAIYVPGGEYTLSISSSDEFNLLIDSQSKNDLIRHSSIRLYTGTNQQDIPFTVPNDSKIVRIYFTSGNGGATIESCSYSGTSNGNVHLNYPLLPNIIANRLQNIFANENMVQRGIFFEDGIKLFSKSPLIGRGLGGYENGIYGVQDFYYETKYAHNHYIQVLSDLGVIGFLLYLSILVFSAVALIRSKLRSRSLFAVPVLSACAFQSFGQALSDATWSSGVFLGFAFAILALITTYCSVPLAKSKSNMLRFIPIGGKGAVILFSALFILLMSGNLYAQTHARSGVKSFDEIENLIALDRFEYNDYKVSYIVNAPKSGDEEVLTKADRYAAELEKVESNSIAPYVMAYNFATNKDFDAFAAAKAGIQYAKSSPTMWWQIFDVCESYIDPVGPNSDAAIDRLRSSQYYIDSILELYNTLLDRNNHSLDKIVLSPYNNTFVGKILEIRDTKSYDTASAMAVLMAHSFDSDYAVDANQDGIPDNITVLTGGISRNEQGVFTVSGNTVLELNLYQKLRGSYTFGVRSETPQGIAISMDESELQTLYGTDKAYATVDLTDNAEMTLKKFKVTIPNDSIIDYIDFKTNLD